MPDKYGNLGTQDYAYAISLGLSYASDHSQGGEGKKQTSPTHINMC